MSVQTYQSKAAPGEVLLQGLMGGLGQAAGQGIGKGLGHLVGLGAEKIGLTGPSQQEIDILKSMGMSEEQAAGFHKLDPRAQQQVLANLSAQKQQQQRASLFGPSKPENAFDQQEPSEDLLLTLLNSGVNEQEMQKLLDEYGKKEGKEPKIKPQFLESPSDIYKDLIRKGADPKLARDAASSGRDEYKIEKKELNEYIKQTQEDAKVAEKNDANLDRMIALINKGNLPPAMAGSVAHLLNKGLHYIDVNVNSLLGADAEEFDKIASSFLLGGSNYFPGRMTDFDAKSYLQTFPALYQSDEAKLRNANLQKIYNQAAILTNNAVQQIKKENGGIVPKNIKDLVEQKIGKKRDVLYEKFKKGLSEIPEFEESIKKAQERSKGEIPASIAGGAIGGTLGSGAGGLIAGPIGAIGGGALGSAIGSYVPRALKGAQEWSRNIEDQLYGQDLAARMRGLDR